MNQFIGLAIGATLTYPTMVQLASSKTVLGTLFAGTPFTSQIHTTFFGIPVITMNYTSTVLPVLFTVWFASIIEHWSKKWIPSVVQMFLVPVVTMIIALPVAFIVIGPVMTGVGAIDPNEYYPNHVAIDFYHHYKEDIKMFAEMGFKTFRLSIAWTRIFPKDDEEKSNQAGLDFYRRVFEECKKYDIEPLVTISHYEDPLYLSEKYHDWQDRKMIDMYVKYAKVLFKEYKGLVKYWLTFNEINTAVMMLDMFGNKNNSDEAYQHAYQKLHYQFVASARAVKAAHEIDPNYVVGNMICGIVVTH